MSNNTITLAGGTTMPLVGFGTWQITGSDCTRCVQEAIACAKTVNARHSIPYHMAPGSHFDEERAELFDAPNRLILPAGEEITLE